MLHYNVKYYTLKVSTRNKDIISKDEYKFFVMIPSNFLIRCNNRVYSIFLNKFKFNE
jgi:hypothetical protein